MSVPADGAESACSCWGEFLAEKGVGGGSAFSGCVATGLSGYLWGGIKVPIQHIFSKDPYRFMYLYCIFKTVQHPLAFPLLLSVCLSIKHSTQTCTKALSSENSLTMSVCVPTSVRVCVCVCVCTQCVPECVSASIAGAYPRFPWWPHNTTRQSEAGPRSAARGH